MKEYSTFPIILLETHHQMQFSVISKTLVVGGHLTSQQRSSSSCRAASTDIPDPLSPLLPIVHRLWQVFRAISRYFTELLYVCSSWPSCFCSAIWGVHRSTSLLQQCPWCLVRLTWIVFVMGGKWPYSWCFVGCCPHDLINIARSILV